VYFNGGDVVPLDPADLDRIIVQAKRGTRCIELCGHADRWRGTAYNAGLGLRRANSVLRRLTDAGINRDRIQICSRGKSTADVNTTRATDRRVDVFLREGETCHRQDGLPP
jgi:outer membrane protein OmpA-like peptidoglycan-associated protein